MTSSLAELDALVAERERLDLAPTLRDRGDVVNAALAQAGILLKSSYDGDVAFKAVASVTRNLDRSIESFRRGNHYVHRIERLQNRRVMIRRRIAEERRRPEPDEEFIEQGERFLQEADEKIVEYRKTYVDLAPRVGDLARRTCSAPIRLELGSRLDRRLACPRPRVRAAVRSSSRGGDSGSEDGPSDPEPPRRRGPDHLHVGDRQRLRGRR